MFAETYGLRKMEISEQAGSSWVSGLCLVFEIAAGNLSSGARFISNTGVSEAVFTSQYRVLGGFWLLLL